MTLGLFDDPADAREDAPPSPPGASDLAVVLTELLTFARERGTAQRTLERGLRVTAYHRDGDVGLTLTRPDDPQGPSAEEATICALHAGWRHASIEPYATRDGRPGWHVRPTAKPEPSAKPDVKLEPASRTAMIAALVENANPAFSEAMRAQYESALRAQSDADLKDFFEWEVRLLPACECRACATRRHRLTSVNVSCTL